MDDHARPRPCLIGHRGAPCYRPEHTAASFRLALAQGADALEPDVVPSRDGVLVVRHDAELSRSTDIAERPEFAHRRRTRSFRGVERTDWFTVDFDWAELATLRAREPRGDRPGAAEHDDEQGLLRLRDLVALMDADERRHHAGLVVEIKHPALFAELGFDMAALLAGELLSLGDSRVLDELSVESFEPSVLRELRWMGVPATIVALVDDREDPLSPDALHPLGLDRLEEVATWADGISVAASHLGVLDDASAADPAEGRRLVDLAHERGLDVLAWTLRPEDDGLPDAFRGRPEHYWRGVLRTGVDGVFADAPDRLRPLIDELSGGRDALRLPALAGAGHGVGGPA